MLIGFVVTRLVQSIRQEVHRAKGTVGAGDNSCHVARRRLHLAARGQQDDCISRQRLEHACRKHMKVTSRLGLIKLLTFISSKMWTC